MSYNVSNTEDKIVDVTQDTSEDSQNGRRPPQNGNVNRTPQNYDAGRTPQVNHQYNHQMTLIQNQFDSQNQFNHQNLIPSNHQPPDIPVLYFQAEFHRQFQQKAAELQTLLDVNNFVKYSRWPTTTGASYYTSCK